MPLRVLRCPPRGLALLGAARRWRPGPPHACRSLRVLGSGQLGHGHRLAGEQRFVHLQLAVQQLRVGGDAVALAQHQQVTAHHALAVDALLLAVSDHQRARSGEVAQRFERTLRLALLHQRDADHKENAAEQKNRLGPVAQCQIDAASGQQHQKHGLGEHIAHDRPGGLGRAAGQHVGAIGGQAAACLGGAQALVAGGGRGGVGRRRRGRHSGGHGSLLGSCACVAVIGRGRGRCVLQFRQPPGRACCVGTCSC